MSGSHVIIYLGILGLSLGTRLRKRFTSSWDSTCGPNKRIIQNDMNLRLPYFNPLLYNKNKNFMTSVDAADKGFMLFFR